MPTEIVTFRTLSRYSASVNRLVYRNLDEFSDAERKADRGGFFVTIHALMNHLLWTDRRWLSDFTGTAYEGPAIGREIHGDYARLKGDHLAAGDDIIALTDEVTEEWLEQTTIWRSPVSDATRSLPNWLCLMNLFNQQTYHRGQLSTYLTQAGVDIGSTDMISFFDAAKPSGA